jgi:hypothetical protein
MVYMKRKTLQGVDTNACKLAEALLVTALHPFSSLGLFNWTEACLDPKLVI